jgi:hypothetical protein
MWVMSRCCTKSAIVVQTTQNKFDHAFSWKCFGVAQEMECCQAPVNATDAEVLGEVIFEFVSSLLQC